MLQLLTKRQLQHQAEQRTRKLLSHLHSLVLAQQLLLLLSKRTQQQQQSQQRQQQV